MGKRRESAKNKQHKIEKKGSISIQVLLVTSVESQNLATWWPIEQKTQLWNMEL